MSTAVNGYDAITVDPKYCTIFIHARERVENESFIYEILVIKCFCYLVALFEAKL